MLEKVLNLLFRCPHRRMSRPVTPKSKADVSDGETYVVCLDCGKQFAYDLERMRIVSALKRSNAVSFIHPDMPKPRR